MTGGIFDRIGTLSERLRTRLGREFGLCRTCGKPTRSHGAGAGVQCHTCHIEGKRVVATDGGRSLEERVNRYLKEHPDASVAAIAGAVDDDPQAVAELVDDIDDAQDAEAADEAESSTSDSEKTSNTRTGDRLSRSPQRSRTGPGTRSGTRIGPQLSDDPTETRTVRILTDIGPIMGVDGADYELTEEDVLELPAMNAQPLVENGAAVVVGGPNDRRDQDDDQEEPVDADTLLMAAMGDPDAAEQVGTKDIDDSSSSSTPIRNVGRPQSALPLAQLDALDHHERRRAASKRGLDWPTTDVARDRLEQTVMEVMREEDERVIDAPTSLGKTHTIAATRWAAREEITGGQPVVHLSKTRAARDEAVETALEHGGDHLVLRARHEACPVAAGNHDPDPDRDADDDHQVITIDGEPASEWIKTMCDGKSMPFSTVHRHLEDHNDQGTSLPCCSGEASFDEDEGDFDETPSTCPAIAQWDTYREGDFPLVLATHNFAHVPSLRTQTHLVVDEEPDFEQDLKTDRVRRAITSYLQHIDAPVQTWESFVHLATYEGTHGDTRAERDATRDALETTPELEWYFRDQDAHMLAPALARAVINAEERSNGRRVGKTPYEPPRLDASAHEEEGWNREWVTVVLDGSNDVKTVRVVPNVGAARSVVGLDAHPALPKWQANTAPWIQAKQVLDPEERRLWRRYERGLRVVQVGEHTRPLTKGKYYADRQVRTLVERLVDEYGDRFRTGITTDSVEERFKQALADAGCRKPETMHYGEEKSRNDFATEEVGLVNGCIDPGDEHILDLLAELDLKAEPERTDRCCEHCGDRDDAPDTPGEGCPDCAGTGWARAHGRGFVGDDAETAQAILASVRENHTAQAAGRYARNPTDPDSSATVFVRTDAMPPGFADVQVPGVVWTYTSTQREIVETLRESSRSMPARELADRVGCSKRHVAKTLAKFIPDEDADEAGPVQAVHNAGPNGATLYSADGLPSEGVADLGGVTANDPVWDSYTWSFAIRDPDVDETSPTGDPSPSDQGVSTVWAWEDGVDPGG